MLRNNQISCAEVTLYSVHTTQHTGRVFKYFKRAPICFNREVLFLINSQWFRTVVNRAWRITWNYACSSFKLTNVFVLFVIDTWLLFQTCQRLSCHCILSLCLLRFWWITECLLPYILSSQFLHFVFFLSVPLHSFLHLRIVLLSHDTFFFTFWPPLLLPPPHPSPPPTLPPLLLPEPLCLLDGKLEFLDQLFIALVWRKI